MTLNIAASALPCGNKHHRPPDASSAKKAKSDRAKKTKSSPARSSANSRLTHENIKQIYAAFRSARTISSVATENPSTSTPNPAPSAANDNPRPTLPSYSRSTDAPLFGAALSLESQSSKSGRAIFRATLNLGHEISKHALTDPDNFKKLIRDRLRHNLVDFPDIETVFSLEFTPDNRPHLHGLILANGNQIPELRQALRRAGGRWGTKYGSGHQVDFKTDDDGPIEGWLSYCLKDTARTCKILGIKSPLIISNDLRRQAQTHWDQLRQFSRHYAPEAANDEPSPAGTTDEPARKTNPDSTPDDTPHAAIADERDDKMSADENDFSEIDRIIAEADDPVDPTVEAEIADVLAEIDEAEAQLDVEESENSIGDAGAPQAPDPVSGSAKPQKASHEPPLAASEHELDITAPVEPVPDGPGEKPVIPDGYSTDHGHTVTLPPVPAEEPVGPIERMPGESEDDFLDRVLADLDIDPADIEEETFD